MAVRTPLYFVSGNLREMDAGMITDLQNLAIYQYSLNPSQQLSVTGSGGNLTSINDTRLQAGDALTSATAFPTEATTAEPSTVTVAYQRILQTAATVTPAVDTGKLLDSAIVEAKIADGAVAAAKLKSVVTLSILNSTGGILKTLYGAGA